MIYKEYNVGLDGLEKRLGVLGETHIYTPDESRFVSKIVPNFDIVASEGTDKNSFFYWIAETLYFPSTIAYIAGTNRSFDNNSAETIAGFHGKQIIKLEDKQSWSLLQKASLLMCGVISMVTSPFIYGYCKIYGDPYETGTKAYKKRMAKKEEAKKNSLYLRLCRYVFNEEKRNQIMADRASDILEKEPGNLLIVFGENHFEGMIENLHRKLKLKEMKSFS